MLAQRKRYLTQGHHNAAQCELRTVENAAAVELSQILPLQLS
jgi:hypothetical protein